MKAMVLNITKFLLKEKEKNKEKNAHSRVYSKPPFLSTSPETKNKHNM